MIETVYLGGRRSVGFGLEAALPSGLRIVQAGGGDPRPLVLVYHLNARVDDALRSAVGPAALIANDSTPYASAAPLSDTTAALAAAVGARLAPVVLAGFSAGGLATQRLLQLGADPDALVIADGTYATTPEGWADWQRYAGRARAGARTFVASHTSLVVPSSTWHVLSAIAGETLPLGAGVLNRPADAPVLREPFERRQWGNFTVYSYPTQDMAGHQYQGDVVLPAMLREAMANLTVPATSVAVAGTTAGTAALGAAVMAVGASGLAYFLRRSARSANELNERSRPARSAILAGAAVGVPIVVFALWPRSRATVSACAAQAAQPFLIRSNYLATAGGLATAVRYRTEQYGYFAGFGDSQWNPHTPSSYAVDTTFMGLPIRLNHRIVPALKCAEADILQTCGSSYRPTALSGLRPTNTYHGAEVSNHVYGIAIDVDPSLNPCCGCVGHWADDPICKRPSKSEYDRMAMPECWVHAFERHGFYWLGHDPQIRDTMHFEFLGEPAPIDPSVIAANVKRGVV